LKVLLKQSGFSGVERTIDFANDGKEAVDLVLKGILLNQVKADQQRQIQNIGKGAEPKDGYLYGLIFMDCSMPRKDGFEATDEIRQIHLERGLEDPVIIACTGHCELEYVEKAWRHSMDELIPKPVKLEVIKEVLCELVTR